MIWLQIVSQCNIYEAGEKKKVFTYMSEQVSYYIYTGPYRSAFHFLYLKRFEFVIHAGGGQGLQFKWAHPV